MKINAEKKEECAKGNIIYQVMDFVRLGTTVQRQYFSQKRCREKGKGKEVQSPMLISVPKITGVPGFVTLSDKVHTWHSYLYIGLNDSVQTIDLN